MTLDFQFDRAGAITMIGSEGCSDAKENVASISMLMISNESFNFVPFETVISRACHDLILLSHQKNTGDQQLNDSFSHVLLA